MSCCACLEWYGTDLAKFAWLLPSHSRKAPQKWIGAINKSFTNLTVTSPSVMQYLGVWDVVVDRGPLLLTLIEIRSVEINPNLHEANHLWTDSPRLTFAKAEFFESQNEFHQLGHKD